jgi:hypothetical protein
MKEASPAAALLEIGLALSVRMARRDQRALTPKGAAGGRLIDVVVGKKTESCRTLVCEGVNAAEGRHCKAAPEPGGESRPLGRSGVVASERSAA